MHLLSRVSDVSIRLGGMVHRGLHRHSPQRRHKLREDRWIHRRVLMSRVVGISRMRIDRRHCSGYRRDVRKRRSPRRASRSWCQKWRRLILGHRIYLLSKVVSSGSIRSHSSKIREMSGKISTCNTNGYVRWSRLRVSLASRGCVSALAGRGKRFPQLSADPGLLAVVALRKSFRIAAGCVNPFPTGFTANWMCWRSTFPTTDAAQADFLQHLVAVGTEHVVLGIERKGYFFLGSFLLRVDL